MDQRFPRGASPAAKAAPHPRVGLNEFLSHPIRLSLVAALASVEEADFASLRDFLQISDSALSRRASQLEEAKLVTIRKGYVGKRPRTWLSLTPAGREAWTSHLAAIKAIAKGLPPSV
ncbi:transcriptional regulator [Propioniciclava tarda]|uniref:Transcriptional regulator n=1 Tax=Propioniciclava tarda TaxID=433330 RepID=A0A4Q9KHW9_PROTD|nr:transcriptional regulator [Propioniciclava tarda]